MSDDDMATNHRRVLTWSRERNFVIVCSCGEMPAFPCDAWRPGAERVAHAEHVLTVERVP